MKNYCILFVGLLSFSSCITTYTLKTNYKIETLNVSLLFSNKIDKGTQEKIKSEFQHTLESWNSDHHKFSLSSVDSSYGDRTDLKLEITDISYPSKLEKILTAVYDPILWLGFPIWAARLNNPTLVYFIPNLTLRPKNKTFMEYSINKKLLDKPNTSIKTCLYTPTFILNNAEKEKIRHLRSLSSKFYIFFDQIERKYEKKNHL